MMRHPKTLWLSAALMAAFVVLTFAMPVAAAEGEAAEFPWVAWAANMFNFLVFAGIIYFFAGDYIRKFFKERRQTLVADLDAARELREKAEARLEEYNARLDALDEERTRLLEEYHEQGEREKERIIEQAKRQVEKMRQDAELTIEQEVSKAVADLEERVVQVAVDLAEQMARERLDEGARRALVDDYVNQLTDLEPTESDRAA